VQAERKTAKSIDWGKERRHGFISRPCASAALAVGGLGFLEAIPTRPTLAKFEKRRSLSSYPFVEHVGQTHQFRTRHDLAKTHERDRAQTKMQQNQ